ncbi:MAG: DinB family protein [Acidobacteria bacterium]|nr:DinB family protein [Acidobacteriota bacterium]
MEKSYLPDGSSDLSDDPDFVGRQRIGRNPRHPLDPGAHYLSLEMLSNLRHFLNYNAWANARAIASIRTVPFGESKAVVPLSHLLIAERFWLHRIQQLPNPEGDWSTMPLDVCEAYARETHERFSAFLETCTDSALAGAIGYRNLSGDPFDTPLRDILTHLYTHGVHHRGQVLAAVRAEGGEPLTLDYIAYQREAGPQPA